MRIAAAVRETPEHDYWTSNQGTAIESVKKRIKIVHWIWLRHYDEHMAGVQGTHLG